ncbi:MULTISPECIES: helix-turn-helix domain-containing protein [Nocardiaceae]|nr:MULTISPECIES: helix-turn-helix domain-containing protein [Rhodococcus]MDJ0005004.1 helix-turn-helix domain-containing protein [Rhodococcus fascians]
MDAKGLMTLERAVAEHLERLNIEQAAQVLGVTKGFLYQQRCAGTGPPSYKLNNRVCYDRRDLELYIARCKAQTLIGA